MTALYRVVDSDFEPLPVRPFTVFDDAKNHILDLQKTPYAAKETFHIVQINVVGTLLATGTEDKK